MEKNFARFQIFSTFRGGWGGNEGGIDVINIFGFSRGFFPDSNKMCLIWIPATLNKEIPLFSTHNLFPLLANRISTASKSWGKPIIPPTRLLTHSNRISSSLFPIRHVENTILKQLLYHSLPLFQLEYTFGCSENVYMDSRKKSDCMRGKSFCLSLNRICGFQLYVRWNVIHSQSNVSSSSPCRMRVRWLEITKHLWVGLKKKRSANFQQMIVKVTENEGIKYSTSCCCVCKQEKQS